jgi:hypothetical protein
VRAGELHVFFWSVAGVWAYSTRILAEGAEGGWTDLHAFELD